MKILLINGSPHEKGCTYTALCEVASAAREAGAETEIFHIGNGPQRGCIACSACRRSGKPDICAFPDEIYTALVEKMEEADGIVIGSPVYYAGPNGSLCALLDRVFFSHGKAFAGKPSACVVSCRRGGASSSFDRLNKYFTINRMPVVSSTYWNSVHGMKPEDVLQDLEGLQVMRTLGRNMVWMIKNLEKGGEELPHREKGIATNFIR